MQPSIKILDIFYGNTCNLACNQCDVRSDIFSKGQYDKTLENILEGINLAVKYFEIQEFSLLGGEPLLYKPRITDILKYIRSFDTTTKINIPTNGLLLKKNLEFVADLIETYNVTIMVSDHVNQFEEKTKSKEIVESVHALGNMLGYEKNNPINYYLNFHDFANTKNDPLFDHWLIRKKLDDIDHIDDTKIYYSQENKGIFYIIYDWFYANHYFDSNHKPKPFNSQDPNLSYSQGCSSEFCSYMYDKKIYKCAALGTLKRFLTHHNALEDTDWQKYLQYKPLDLTNCTKEEVQYFSDTKYSCINECTMCPANGQKIIKTEDMVLPTLRNV